MTNRDKLIEIYRKQGRSIEQLEADKAPSTMVSDYCPNDFAMFFFECEECPYYCIDCDKVKLNEEYL